MQIGGFTIGAGRCLVVAELSGNMNGSLEMAKAMVLEAQRCGADAVKVQTLDPFEMPDNDEVVKEGVVSRWIGRRWLDVYKATYLPWQDQLTLKRFAEDIGMTFFASVYSPAAVDFWERNGGLPAYKIASWQSEDMGLLWDIYLTGTLCMASTEKPWPFVPLLLNGILLAKDSLDLRLPNPWGFSNHGDPMQCVEAVKRGAVIVEQHFRIDEGLDTFAALPAEFKAMVKAIREVER